jgi:diguanylate cyclase
VTGVYDLPLVALSYLIATVASYVALDVAARVTAARGWVAAYWLAGGAGAMGIGIWSMHFVGMLAFRLPIPMDYDPNITFGSLLIAVIVAAFALWTVSRATLSAPRLVFAGTTMGFGIAAMHYVGMAALEIAPGIRYDLGLVAVSIVIAIGASCAALWLAFVLRSETVSALLCKKLGSAAVMGAAIVGMHYTGMAAASFAHNTICTSAATQVTDEWLAVAIAVISMLILGGMMLNSVIDARMNRSLAAANARISELAQRDTVTGLANRRAFLERLAIACAAAKRSTDGFAVLLLDLDNFKNVNDTLGHPSGDALLCEVAVRLTEAARDTDLVARLGGDEFAILQMHVSEDADAGVLAARIASKLGMPCSIDGSELRLTASIGIAVAAARGAPGSADTLVMQADLALYRAKDDGRNCYRFHSAELDERVHERVVVAEELRRGVERGELELHYQPQVAIPTGEIIGLEALVRWNHPVRGLVMPNAFIPIAERTGSIGPLGRWIIDETCRQLRAWHDQGVRAPRVAVNVSALQLRRGSHLVEELTTSLSRWGMTADMLEIELTESVLMQAAQRDANTLGRLRELGCRIAIDDFGTGYSSLAYLTDHSVSRLKIAQALVSRAPTDRRSAAVVHAAIDLGQTLEIEVIAEGVETAAHVDFLSSAGCEQAQGFYFGRPLGAPQIGELLRKGSLKPADDTDAKGQAAKVAA